MQKATHVYICAATFGGAAVERKTVKLTALGEHYRRLSAQELI
jgi:hypothetical protein